MSSKIKLICVGKVKEPYIKTGIDEFLKRIKPLSKLEIIELNDDGIKKESIKILEYNSQNTYIFDAKGKQYSSEEFAEFIKKNETEMNEIIFIIGGPEGIDEKIKSKFKTISLSKMTFTHEMTRLFLLEQIYRASMINSGRTYYHK